MACRRLHEFGIAAIDGDTSDLLPPAEVFISFAAELALAAGPVNPGYSDPIADLQILYRRAFFDHDPGDLVALGVEPGGPVEVRFGHDRRTGRWVESYAEAGPLELAVVVDSYGLVSLTADRRPVAEELGLRAGSAVTLGPVPVEAGA